MSRELANVPADPAPILVADSHIFMELAYYEDPKVRGRLVYALSPELERRYTNTDTTALIFSALRHRAPLPMPDYKAFLALNKRFLLAANGNDWIVWNLIASGYRVIPLQGRWSPGVFLVQAPDAIVRQ
jgi:hypothetical protein